MSQQKKSNLTGTGVQSNMISAPRVYINGFQHACETGEFKDTPKGETRMKKALIKSSKAF